MVYQNIKQLLSIQQVPLLTNWYHITSNTITDAIVSRNLDLIIHILDHVVNVDEIERRIHSELPVKTCFVSKYVDLLKNKYYASTEFFYNFPKRQSFMNRRLRTLFSSISRKQLSEVSFFLHDSSLLPFIVFSKSFLLAFSILCFVLTSHFFSLKELSNFWQILGSPGLMNKLLPEVHGSLMWYIILQVSLK